MSRSRGLSPQDFVGLVYYVTEGVRWGYELWPTDDKYKEVLTQARLQLANLQTEDWSWLRERVILGPCWDYDGKRSIPEFQLPADFYKPAMSHKDAVRLHPQTRHCHGCHHHECRHCQHIYLERPVHQVKWTSQGAINSNMASMYAGIPGFQNGNELKAAYTGQGIVTFNRPFSMHEQSCIAETDMILRLPEPHICDDSCPNFPDTDAPDSQVLPTRCPDIEETLFDWMPDPMYMVYLTAIGHGQFSPPAALAVAAAQEKAQQMRSAMLANDGMKTTSDVLAYETMDFFRVI